MVFSIMPLRVASGKEPFRPVRVPFGRPSSGQALRHPEGTRPVMDVVGPLMFVAHATAAINQ